MSNTASFWFAGEDATPDGPSIGQSLRFRGTQSLTRTFTVNSNITWTWSGWLKKSQNTTLDQVIFHAESPLQFSASRADSFGWTQQSVASFEDAKRRDPSAWYHRVDSYDGTYMRMYINGALALSWEVVSTGWNAATTHDIGYDSARPSEGWIGYMSDIYFIDGQSLGPEAFGEYDENDVWVPREVNFGVGSNEVVYSDYLTASNGDFITSPKLAFNGDIDPSSTGSGRCYTDIGADITWAPVTPVPFTTSLEIFNTNQPAQQEIIWDGNTTNPTGGWVTVYSGSGEVSADKPLYINSIGAQRAELHAVRIDGELVNDPFIWSSMLTDTGIGTGSDRAYFFQNNGLSTTFSAPGPVVFTPTTPIQVREKVSLWVESSGCAFAVNTSDGGALTTAVSGQYTDFAFTGELQYVHIGLTGEESLTRLAIDGVQLIDGVNASFGTNGFHLDFSDPNDLGADRSGNGNDFTATGFDTVLKRSGDYADPSLTTYDQATNTVPTQFGGPPYIIDIQDDLNSGTWCTFNPSGWSNGVVTGPGNTNGTYVGEPYAQFFTFDLRDFPTVTSVAVWSGWNQPSDAGNAYAELLDENKNLIVGTRVNIQRHNDFSVRYELSGTDVGARYIRFDCSATDSNVFIYGIEVNNGLIYQGADTNPDYDLVLDSPTQNYATLNAVLDNNQVLSDGNLTGGTGSSMVSLATQVPSQKVYWEGKGSNYYYGISAVDASRNSYVGQQSDQVGWFRDGTFWVGAVDIGTLGPAYTVDDISMLAYDPETGKLWVGINGIWHNSGDPAAGTGEAYTVSADFREKMVPANNVSSGYASINFGQQPFAFTPPEGFYALQTQNLSAPIPNGRDHFQAITGPGNGASSGTPGGGNWTPYLTSVSGFQSSNPPADAFDGSSGTYAISVSNGDWTFAPEPPIPVTSTVEVFQFNNAGQTSWNGSTLTPNGTSVTFSGSGEISASNPITATSVGTGQACFLNKIVVDGEVLVDSNILALAQQTFPNGLWWIKDRQNSNQHQFVDSVRGGDLALTCPTKSAQNSYSAPSGESVAWCWQTDGNGLNTDAGFQILTYTGVDATSQVIPHNLDPSKPLDLVIVKGYDAPGTSTYVNSANWLIWHNGMQPNNYAYLNTDGALNGTADSFWTSTGLNTTLGNLTVGNDPDTNNGPSVRGGAIEYVAYLWQEVPGYSAFGSFDGNSSTDGPFIHLGFRPSFFMWKRYDGSGNWEMRDTTRHTTNPDEYTIYANRDYSEAGPDSLQLIDILSNGIKIRTNQANMNQGKLIYAAFAENPFSYPANAR